MYKEHQPTISRHVAKSQGAFADLFRFVIATIRQPLYSTPLQVKDFKRLGSQSVFAFSYKAPALDWLADNEATLYRDAMNIADAAPDPDRLAREATFYFATLPGLGLVKGGFMAQLAFGVSGCLDSHNAARFGLRPSMLRADRFKNAATKTQWRRLDAYLSAVNDCGGTELLWDEWCAYVAERAPQRYENAYAASALHCSALGL